MVTRLSDMIGCMCTCGFRWSQRQQQQPQQQEQQASLLQPRYNKTAAAANVSNLRNFVSALNARCVEPR